MKKEINNVFQILRNIKTVAKSKKSSYKKIRIAFKWLAYFIGSCILLIIAILLFFRIQAMFREKNTRHDAAPKTGRFVHANDIEMFIQEMGPVDGPAVVFTHGFGAWSGMWQESMSTLSQAGFHTIAIDMPPFGFSERPVDNTYSRQDQAKRIIGLLDTLQIKKAILVGHSYGGRSTMEAVFSNPKRFSALVLVNVALDFDTTPSDTRLRDAAFSIPPVRSMIVASALTNPLLTQKLLESFVYDPTVWTPERVVIYQQPLGLKNSTNDLGEWLVRDMFALSTPAASNTESSYQKLDIPVLIIWGDKDTVTPLPQGEHIARLIPHAEFVVLPNVGHIPQIENVQGFNNAILPFLIGSSVESVSNR